VPGTVPGTGFEVVGDALSLVADRLTNPRAFIWQNGKMTALGTLGGKSSAAVAINDRGQVAGWSETKTGVGHAFLWQLGKMRDLGTLSGKKWSSAVAINARGQVIGDSFGRLDREGADAAPVAFVWQNGKMTGLGTLGAESSTASAINDSGQIVGNALGKNTERAFSWQNGKASYLAMPPRATGSVGVAVNNRGQVVGSAGGPGTMAPFLWEGGRATALGVFNVGGDDPESNPAALNEHDQIVGTSHAMIASQHATLWTKRR
jgi:probable HAF family extracellular repeat protein